MRDMGGAELNLLNILTHLDCSQFRFFLYTFQLESPMLDVLAQNNIRCVQIPYPVTFKGLKRYFGLAREVKEKKVDILHTYFEGADIWGTLLAKLTGIPVVVSSKRDMGFSKNKKILLAYRFINPFITKIISVSEAVKKQVHVQEKTSLNKIVTIYNGLDINKFNNVKHNSTLKKELNLSSSSAIVGLLANISPVKGIEYLIYAASKVLKQFHDVQFIIIGSCIPSDENLAHFSKLKTLVKELKLENNFFFIGSRKDIPAILSIIDISVLSSLSEGFSNAIIESMAAAKPLVVTDVGGNSEAVINKKTGFVVPPYDSDRLAQAISILLNNPKLGKTMGEVGRKRAEQVFSIETMINRIENLYFSTLNNKNFPVNKVN